jgi:hypothetical protein
MMKRFKIWWPIIRRPIWGVNGRDAIPERAGRTAGARSRPPVTERHGAHRNYSGTQANDLRAQGSSSSRLDDLDEGRAPAGSVRRALVGDWAEHRVFVAVFRTSRKTGSSPTTRTCGPCGAFELGCAEVNDGRAKGSRRGRVQPATATATRGRCLAAVVGVSVPGRSSFAFDLLSADARRRIIESPRTRPRHVAWDTSSSRWLTHLRLEYRRCDLAQEFCILKGAWVRRPGLSGSGRPCPSS